MNNPDTTITGAQNDPSKEKFSGSGLAIQVETVNADPLQGAEELPVSFFTNVESESPLLAARKMAAHVANSDKVVFLKLLGGPVIVSAKISPEQAVKNFEQYQLTQVREKLGILWTDAKEKYEELAKKVSVMSAEQRRQFLRDFTAHRESAKDFGAIVPFIVEPTFDLAMSLAGELRGENDAVKLTRLVEKLSAFLPQE